jgi:hypothetical protein
VDETPPCKTDPRAPHGFDRNASHSADRYVCECEGWEPPPKRVEPWDSMPVAFINANGELSYFKQANSDIPLYTASPKREWVSLTDEEIKEIVGQWGETPIKGYTRKLFDAIEAKLREKNT